MIKNLLSTVAFLLFAATINAQVITQFIGTSGCPTYNGDTSNPVVVQFNKTTTVPSSPLITATFSYSNQQFLSSEGNPNTPGSTFGSNTSTGGTAVSENLSPNQPVYDLMNVISTPLNNMFTATSTSATGTGIAVTTNRAVALYNTADALIDATGNSAFPLNVRVWFSDLTITFSQPVTNPMLQIVGLGGQFFYQTNSTVFYNIGYSTELVMQSGISMTKKSGNTSMAIVGDTIRNTSTNFGVNSQGATINGILRNAASGTIQLNGTGITSVTFRVYLKGDGGRIANSSGTATAATFGNQNQWSTQLNFKPFLTASTQGSAINSFNGDKYLIGISYAECPELTDPSADQTICAGYNADDISVTSNSNTAASVRFVRFSTDQMAGATPTPAEAAAIYAATVDTLIVTPTGTVDPYLATITGAQTNLASEPAGTYYYYAISNLSDDPDCRPVQEIKVTTASCLVTGNFSGTQDFDGDGIPNSLDIDDDNDGVTDADEILGCVQLADFGAPVTGSNTYAGVSTTNSGYLPNGNAVTISENSALSFIGTTSSDVNNGSCFFSTNNFAPNAQATADMLRMNVWGSASTDFMNITFANPVNEFYFYVKYLHYSKIVFPAGVTLTKISGSPDLIVDNVTRTIKDSTPNTFTSNSCNDYLNQADGVVKVSGTNLSSLNVLTIANIAAADFYSFNIGLPSCFLDSDGDGIANEFDLDSDGDGCYDAYEGGAMPFATDSIASPVYGANGLSNSLETSDDDTATTTYTNTYSNYAINPAVNLCSEPDCDGDGIINLVDIDDDNDGILDAAEMVGCERINDLSSPIIGASSTTAYTVNCSATGTLPTGDGCTISETSNKILFSDFGGNAINTGCTFSGANYGIYAQAIHDYLLVYTSASATAADKILIDLTPGTKEIYMYVKGLDYSKLKFPSTLSISKVAGNSQLVVNNITNEVYDANNSTINSIACSAGASSAEGVIRIAGADLDSFYISNPNYKSGSVDNWAFNMSLPYCYFDTDNDGIMNACDLDSDGDNCPDSYESGSTTDQFVTKFTGAVGANGLDNTLENNDLPTATTNYVLNYTPAKNPLLKACCSATRPILKATSFTNLCPDSTVNLNLVFANTPGVNSKFEWYNNSARTGSPIANVSNMTTGTYWPFCIDTFQNCFVGTEFATNVVITNCNSCDNTNLVYNGNFELGNVGFEHNYIYYPNASPTNAMGDSKTGHYAIIDDTYRKNHPENSFYAVAGDHTTGATLGKFMSINAGENAIATNQTVWKQKIAGLLPGKKYTFSYWAHDDVMNWDQPNTLNDGQGHIGSRPGHGAMIDSTVVISQNPFPYLTKELQSNWKQHQYTFTANASGIVALEIYNINHYMAHGNDWVLDDIELKGFCDYDGDGVADEYDIDDDNDGLLDTQEGCDPSYAALENFGTFGSQAIGTRRNLTTAPVSYTYAAAPTALAAGNYAVAAKGGANTLSLGADFEAVYGHTSVDSLDAYLAINQSATTTTFYSAPFTITSAGPYDFGAFATNASVASGLKVNVGVKIKSSANPVLASASTGDIISSTVATTYKWVEAKGTVTLPVGTYTIEVYNIGPATSGVKFGIDDIYVLQSGKDNACLLDTDGDLIPDACDLDSDGDGCSDACEAGLTAAAGATPGSTTLPGPYGANGLANSVETNDGPYAKTNFVTLDSATTDFICNPACASSSCTLGNYVWNDLNGDGIQNEAPTSGINGVKVYLYKVIGGIPTLVDSQLTANDPVSGNSGAYLFSNLPSGDYQVSFPINSPTGVPLTTQTATPTTDSNSDANATTGLSPIVTLNANGTGQAKNNTTIDAGYFAPPASLGNKVWVDLDGDGTDNGGTEAGLPGATVYLYNALGVIIDSATTDGSGNYLFDSLASGTYSVGFKYPVGYGPTQQTSTTDNNVDGNSDASATPVGGIYKTAPVVLSSGENNLTVDAGVVPLASIGNQVWVDTDGDGLLNNGEIGLPGATVYLIDNTGAVIDSATTNGSGNYLFDKLQPGTYSVGFKYPAGYNPTTQTGTTDNNTDNNSDAATTPNANGMYVTAPVALAPGENNMTVDAGVIAPASLGNKVWVDLDGDGTDNGGTEAGLPGATVYLYNAAGTILDSTTTDGSGNYLFDTLKPGTYSVGFKYPAGYGPTQQTGTTDNNVDGNNDASTTPTNGIYKTAPVVLSSGENNLTVDAGVVPFASIGNQVWVDTDGDGLLNNGETGLPGATVYLIDNTGAVIDSTTTNGTGNYLFDELMPGTYSVGFKYPAGYIPTPQTGTTDNNTDNNSDAATTPNANGMFVTAPVALAPGENNLTVDAGVLAPASLGNKVWIDLDGDGTDNGGTEAGLPGATVYLYDATGTIIDSTTTDGSGNYLFDTLKPGTYSVGFKYPAGYGPTQQTGATDNNVDGNNDASATPTNGIYKTAPVVLSSGENNLTVDAGVVPFASIGNQVWVDTDGDGLLNNGETGLPGATVYLIDNTGAVIDSTTTNGSGNYLFDELMPGTYSRI
jgi:hypothetical protein